MALVQSKLAASPSSTPVGVTMDNPATAGNLIVVFVAASTATAIGMPLGDGLTTTTSLAGGSGGTSRASRLFWKVAAGGEQTFGPWVTNTAQGVIIAAEYDSIVAAPLLIADAALTVSASTHTSPSVTPTSGKKALVVGAWGSRALGITWSAENYNVSNPMTEREDGAGAGGAPSNAALADAEIASTTGSYTVVATRSVAAVASAHIAIFELTAGGGGGPTVAKQLASLGVG